MTSPGIPMIFMGQEFLEDGYFDDSTPLDWTKTTTYAGILALYTDLDPLAPQHATGTRTGSPARTSACSTSTIAPR